jgi:hypothetical protein
MKRRTFIFQAGLAAGGSITNVARAGERIADSTQTPGGIRWKRAPSSNLFSSVVFDGEPLVTGDLPGLLDGRCRLWSEAPESATHLSPGQTAAQHGPLRVELRHQLRDTGAGLGEDLLEATLIIRNESDRPQQIETVFATSAQPNSAAQPQQVCLPLTAAGLNGDKRFAALGVNDFLKDCRQTIGPGVFHCHYLEPMASYPDERETKALLLAPVVELDAPATNRRVALFTPSDQPMKFSAKTTAEGRRVWQAGRVATIAAGATLHQRCWLMIHRWDANVAWKAFHRFGHHEDHPPIAWPREFKVHYFDFLSAAGGNNKPRGGGYDADLARFREFHVGLATQHGYYPYLGDYIHPDRKNWQAMLGDKQGPATMSLDKMRARIKATRATGAKAGVYIHPVLFDDACPGFKKLRDSVLVGAEGKHVRFPWQGPDTVGRNWRASLNSPQWTEHLLQQVEWIMELLQPDAICVDETFAGLGYDHHPERAGPMSAAAIDWHRKLRTLVRSYGDDRAVFTSDCSMSPFVQWADGEVGDHAYAPLLGHPLYAQEPVRYLAALGDKPWRPCAWHWQGMWQHQMRLARRVGAGVGVSNGWVEFTGLTSVEETSKARYIADIATLFQTR